MINGSGGLKLKNNSYFVKFTNENYILGSYTCANNSLMVFSCKML